MGQGGKTPPLSIYETNGSFLIMNKVVDIKEIGPSAFFIIVKDFFGYLWREKKNWSVVFLSLKEKSKYKLQKIRRRWRGLICGCDICGRTFVASANVRSQIRPRRGDNPKF
jgi:hypothetical protein